MSELHRTPTRPTARKPHICEGCCHKIPVGEKYVQQEGYYEGEAYRNRYHAECFDVLSASGDFDFTPGCLNAPARLRSNAGVDRTANGG